jgi:hypothetical protein
MKAKEPYCCFGKNPKNYEGVESNMRRISTPEIKQFGQRTLAILFFALVTLTLTTAAKAQNVAGPYPPPAVQPKEDLRGYDLTGTWMITITPDDGSPSFVGYYSFFADGNASFSSAGPPIPALGNPGYGVWTKVSRNKFAATIRMNSYAENFQFDGTLNISARIQMTSADSFVTQDTVKVLDPDGNEIVTLGGGAKGTRMKVE